MLQVKKVTQTLAKITTTRTISATKSCCLKTTMIRLVTSWLFLLSKEERLVLRTPVSIKQSSKTSAVQRAQWSWSSLATYASLTLTKSILLESGRMQTAPCFQFQGIQEITPLPRLRLRRQGKKRRRKEDRTAISACNFSSCQSTMTRAPTTEAKSWWLCRRVTRAALYLR